MREIKYSTDNFTKVDFLNARNGKALRDYDNQTIKVEKLAVLDVQEEEDEEIKEVGVLVTDDGTVLTCISSGAISMIKDTIPIIEEDGLKLSYKVDVRESKGGREFIALTALV